MTKRVLVVEDDASVAFLIKDGLADLGAKFYVETAPSAEVALEKISQSKWDLVVTDQRMPGMTGLQLIETLKDRTPTLLTVLITAYGSEEMERAAQQLNVYHYMAKPFPLVDLKRVIEDALAFSQNDDPPSGSTNGRGDPRGLKITLGGDGNVGKTTLIRRLCTGKFQAARVMTIGVDFHLYDIQHDNQPARLIVWDVSGQDQFEFTRRAFYRGSKAVGLVYDVSNRASFERLAKWRAEIQSIVPNIPFILAGNKSDLGRQVSLAEGIALAQAWRVPFFETSCLRGDGVRELFHALAHVAMDYIPPDAAPLRTKGGN
ncbi:MAG: GTP-binding protein [Chloroflexi bacterium]|nr:GTP-binding protein [Chloroflexota bacterium]